MEVIAIERGRLFHLVSVQPYTRKDGSASALAVWRGTCRVCGSAFELTTSGNLNCLTSPSSNSLGRVHCDEHKRVRRKDQAGSVDQALQKSPATASTEPFAPTGAHDSE